MIDKTKESQKQSLAELQQELKSLKALLLSRGPGIPSTPSALPPFTGRPSIPAWQLAGTNPNMSSGGWESPAQSEVGTNGKEKEADVLESN
jgi:peroxin-14